MMLEQADSLPRVNEQSVIWDGVAPLHAHMSSARYCQAVEDLCPPEEGGRTISIGEPFSSSVS